MLVESFPQFERANAFVLSDDFAGLAKVDVHEYYASIELDRLRRVLCDVLDCPQAAVEHILDLLHEWQDVWGVRGVPVGPEASGIIGNAMLHPLDQALREAGVRFTRRTDDVEVYLRPHDDWDAIHGLITNVLGSLGLSLNEAKTTVATTVVEARMLSGIDRFLDRTDALLREDRTEGLRQVRTLFDAEVERPDPSGRRIRYALKVLANAIDGHGLDAVVEQPRLRHIAPSDVGRYIARLRETGIVDEDWLIHEATTDVSAADVAGQYHLILALRAGRHRLSPDGGERLRAMALDDERPRRMATRVAAADAWARAKGWEAGGALAAARHSGDGQLRRAFVLSVRSGSKTPTRRDFDRMRTYEDVAPALAWVKRRSG